MRDRVITLAIVAGFFAVLIWWNGRAKEDAETRAVPKVKQWSLRNFGDGETLIEKNRGAHAIIAVAIEDTVIGEIDIEFFPEVAPSHVENFIILAEAGFYDGLTFHRLVPGLVLQGGDQEGDGTGSPGWRVAAEFNEKNHLRGTVGMARRDKPNSAGSQFYICLSDVPMWDGQYTVFGQVVSGMEHIDQLAAVGAGSGDRPNRELVIQSVRITNPVGVAATEDS